MDYRVVNYMIIRKLGRRGMRLQPEQQDATRKQGSKKGSSEDKVNNSPNLLTVIYCAGIHAMWDLQCVPDFLFYSQDYLIWFKKRVPLKG